MIRIYRTYTLDGDAADIDVFEQAVSALSYSLDIYITGDWEDEFEEGEVSPGDDDETDD